MLTSYGTIILVINSLIIFGWMKKYLQETTTKMSGELFMGEQDHQWDETPGFRCGHKAMFREMSQKRKLYFDLDDRIPRQLAVNCHQCSACIVLARDEHDYVSEGEVQRVICSTCMKQNDPVD